MKKKKAKAGDLFVVPMSNGLFAVGKILWRGVAPHCSSDLQAGIYKLVSQGELKAVSVVGHKPLQLFYLAPCCFEAKHPSVFDIVGNEPIADYEKGLSRRNIGSNFFFEDEWLGSRFDGRIPREEWDTFPDGSGQLPIWTSGCIHELFGLPPIRREVIEHVDDFPWLQATEWTIALTRSRKGTPIEKALSAVLSVEYAEMDEAYEALAAAEVMATSRGFPAKNVPEEVVEWVQKRKDKLDASLVGLALRAVERIRDHSELQHELNSESPGESDNPDPMHDWMKHIHDLVDRLNK